MQFTLIINPRAAGGRAMAKRRVVEAAMREAGLRPSIVLTEAPRHATRLARRALAAGAEGIAVVGGDGTFSETLAGFFDERGEPVRPGAWLSPLPCGTGGDFRRTVYPGRTLRSLAAGIKARPPRALDVGWVEFDTGSARVGRAFLNIASFGLGGLVDRFVNDAPKRLGGRVAFALGTLRALRSYAGPRVRVQVGDEAFVERIANVAVANGQYFGGGMHIAPEAQVDDGFFDVVTLRWRGPLRQTALARDLYGGTILRRKDVRHHRGNEVEAVPLGSEDVLLDVDGEAPGRLPARFSIRRGIVRLR